MNILFLTLSRFDDIKVRGIYTDLMRELISCGHHVFIASPAERRFGKKTHLVNNDNCDLLKVWTLNIQKTNVIEKGIGTIMLEYQFDRAIQKYWSSVKFDLVLYSTPPITFNRVIERIKRRCGCRSYLMLKDIFPQNAVDLGMMKKGSFLYNMFRNKERRLYQLSDTIGCMSPANCEYIIRANPELAAEKVEVCPNAIKPIDIPPISNEERSLMLAKLNIPSDRTLFIYGGNLGKPQGIDFLLKVIEANESRHNSHILVVGSGTEFPKIATWFAANQPINATLLAGVPKEEYDDLVRMCDVGLIFLDPRFTIPNFPSRLLSYLENSMPVLLAIDPNTDIGRIAEANGFGMATINGELELFMNKMAILATNHKIVKEMGERGRKYFLNNYTVDKVAAQLTR